MHNIKIYFVLYIALLCETFIVISDRDDAISEIESYILTGIGPDFNIVAPDSVLNITIFSAPQFINLAKSDTIKTIILGKTFLQDDIIITKPWPRIIIPPHNRDIDTDSILMNVTSSFQDSLKTNYVFSVSYSGENLKGVGKRHYDSCYIEVNCEILRLIGKHRMKLEILEEGDNKYVELPYNINKHEDDIPIRKNEERHLKRKIIKLGDNEYVTLYGKTNIKIFFNNSHFEIPNIPIRNR